MQVRKKDKFEAVQVTQEVKNESGQATIRALIAGVTQVELFQNRISVSTRYARYDFSIGDWILKDGKGAITRITDIDFKMNYEVNA